MRLPIDCALFCLQRMTRLTNAFSKKWANVRYAYALWFAFYNFCRIHKTLRVTPAMESGLTNHQWSPANFLGQQLANRTLPGRLGQLQNHYAANGWQLRSH